MKKEIQKNTGLKLLAAVLCCLFLGVAAGTAAGTFWEVRDMGYEFLRNPGDVSSFLGENSLVADYQYMVMDFYQLNELRELNTSEVHKFDEYVEKFSKGNTNFCFRLLQPDGETLLENLDGEAIENVVKVPQYLAVVQYRNDIGNYGYSGYGDGTELDELMDYYHYDEDEDAWFEEEDYYSWNDKLMQMEEEGAEAEEIVDDRCELIAVMEWGIADGIPVDDDLAELARDYRRTKTHIAVAIVVEVVCVLGWLFTLTALLYGCGHKKGVEGIYLAKGHRCPADLLLVLEAVLIVVGVSCALWVSYTFDYIIFNGGSLRLRWWIGICFALGMLVLLPFLTTVTAQRKARQLWKRTLCYHILWGALGLIRAIGLFWKVVLGYCLLEGVVLWSMYRFANWWDAIYLWIAAGVVVAGLLLLLWWLTGWRKARIAAEKLAQGDLRYQTEAGHVPWDLKKHINNLNEISGGMQKAVQEQMKSERFRTELITNVSHDLKTPLTSIINYVDLLKKQEIPDATSREYIDVLDRKSQRLKTLTEDLVEASKAATGVLAVNAERLDAGQLVNQALGEYEEKLAMAGLKTVVQMPKEPVYIHADGRHLWRILDNLLGNCAKYAMPGTRVYVTLETAEGIATIAVKNISADPLNVPAEDLMERFVRGDSSRTNEGSGLGLSIAQSLAAIQGATFRVAVDGDLFKAEVRFPIVP